MNECPQAITPLILTDFDCFLTDKHRFSARRKNRISKTVNHAATCSEGMANGFWFACSQPLKRLWPLNNVGHQLRGSCQRGRAQRLDPPLPVPLERVRDISPRYELSRSLLFAFRALSHARIRQSSQGSCRVKIHVQDAEPNVLGLQRVDDPDQIPHTPRQAVKLADNKRVAFAAKIDCAFKLRTGRDRGNLFAENLFCAD
jgi:hypothetical protein